MARCPAGCETDWRTLGVSTSIQGQGWGGVCGGGSGESIPGRRYLESLEVKTPGVKTSGSVVEVPHVTVCLN